MRSPNDLIAVKPTNNQQIVRFLASQIKDVVIRADGVRVDVTDESYISQKGLGEIRNFEMIAADGKVMGFHDHPNEMWITERFRNLAESMQAHGWLRIEFPR